MPITFHKQGAATAGPLVSLKKLIEHTIANFPFPHGGHLWCAMLQPDMAKALGISVSTLRRRIKTPGIIRRTIKGQDGAPITLLRTGEADAEEVKYLVQKQMAKIWDAKTGKKHTPHAFGCFAPMVGYWGPDKAPAMLTLVLTQWSRFMAGVHMEIVNMEGGKKTFLDYPTAATILKFHSVVAAMWNEDQQADHPNQPDYAEGWKPTKKQIPAPPPPA
jgi:hypothetical protein